MAFNHGHALIIGVGTYAYIPQMNLPITAADAEAVATVLRNPAYCGYPAGQVTLLHDYTATRAGILAALDALAQRTGQDDTIVLFYSGHGHTGRDGNYYLTTYDTRLTAGQVTPDTGVRETDLIAKLRNLPAQRILILINACHAGELSPVLDPGQPPFTGDPVPEKMAATLLATGTGRVIITACREDQYAYIGNGALTLFTQALVHGLQGKGDYISNRHGFISVFDLYRHLYDTIQNQVAHHIPANVRQRYSAVQEPELTVLKGMGSFAVALYRGATALGEFQAPGYATGEGAVHKVDEERRERLASQLHQQTISGNAQVGAAVAGDVHGNINVDRHIEADDMRFEFGGFHFSVPATHALQPWQHISVVLVIVIVLATVMVLIIFQFAQPYVILPLPIADTFTDNTSVPTDTPRLEPPELTSSPTAPPATSIPTTVPEVVVTPVVPNLLISSNAASPTKHPVVPNPPPIPTPTTIPVLAATDTSIAPLPFTSIPEPTETPTICATDLLAGGFGKLYQDDVSVRVRLGCPTEAQVVDQAVVQFFENGMMYWWEQTDTIYVMPVNSAEYWAIEPEEAAQYPSPTPDQESSIPLQGGFGRVYAGIPEIGSQLGMPLTGEKPLDLQSVRQRFEYGSMLFIPANTDPYDTGKLIVVLYDDRTFTRHADTYQD